MGQSLSQSQDCDAEGLKSIMGVDKKSIIEKLAKPYVNRTRFLIYQLCNLSYWNLGRRKRLKIFMIEGQTHYVRIIPYFKNDSFFFSIIPFQAGGDYFHQFRKLFKAINPVFNIKNMIVLCNTSEQMPRVLEAGFSALFCNHNCWLDENIFKITNLSQDRKYNMVLNTRPEKWKRPYLARRIDKLAIIKGSHIRKEDYFDLRDLNPAFYSHSRISPAEVCKIYNQSLCGGIFSDGEGACYSSSEYLLSGLPVVSCKSGGGRDVWYDQDNSVICEANEESVLDAFGQVSQKLIDGRFSRQEIRQRHIEKSFKFRDRFINYVQTILDEHNVKKNATDIFKAKYIHKMINEYSFFQTWLMLK